MEPVAHKLAYDVAVRSIDDQARVLEGLRSRAGTLFAATALVSSFLGGQALTRAISNDGAPQNFDPWTFTGLAIAFLVVLAVLTILILLPYRMRFSVSASEMLAIIDGREPDDAVTPEEAYRELDLRYEAMYDFNAMRIRVLMWFFRIGIICLVGEVGSWIVVLWRRTL